MDQNLLGQKMRNPGPDQDQEEFENLGPIWTELDPWTRGPGKIYASYIDDDDGCWRRNVLVTFLRCW